MRHPAVIMGLSITGLAAIRSLGERGIPCIGVDATSCPIGRFSKYCHYLQYSVNSNSDQSLLGLLMAVAEKIEGKGVLYPTSDEYVRFVARSRDVLKESFAFRVPSTEMVEGLVNKKEMYRWAEEIGVAIPRTIFPKTRDELLVQMKDMRFPCIMKPAYQFMVEQNIMRKLIVVYNIDDLILEFDRASNGDPRLVIQEIIPGDDNQILIYLAYCGRKGEPDCIFTGRKLRQYPIRYGTASLAESLWLPEVADAGRRFLAGLGYEGLAGIEFKKDLRDGQLKLMEINTRLVQWHGLAKACGVDVCYFQYCDLIGETTPKVTVFDERKKWIFLLQDIPSSLKYMNEGSLSVKDWLLSLRNIRYVAEGSLKDPIPLIISISRLLIVGLRKTYLQLMAMIRPKERLLNAAFKKDRA